MAIQGNSVGFVGQVQDLGAIDKTTGKRDPAQVQVQTATAGTVDTVQVAAATDNPAQAALSAGNEGVAANARASFNQEGSVGRIGVARQAEKVSTTVTAGGNSSMT